jgi:ABC-type multidrug transport system ATPase subunit
LPLRPRNPNLPSKGNRMIDVQHLTKRYGEKTAVDDLTFTVKPGVVTGFLGPNGAGKSTTMRLMIGLDAPTTGAVTVGGRAYRDFQAPLHEIGALLEPGRCIPAARPITICWRWPRPTASRTRGSMS